MTVYSILEAYAAGEISVSECWDQLAGIRANKKRSKNDIQLTAPPSKVYEKLNNFELTAIESLQIVSFGAARGASRFVSNVKNSTELTARQREYLRGLVYRYRRQLFKGMDRDRRAREYVNSMKGTPDV